MQKFSSSDTFPKVRLIVSSIDTFNYKLAGFLCHVLSPLVPNECSSRKLFLLLLKLKIKIFNDNPNLNITKKNLKKFFFFATSKTHFLFFGKFYNQIDGVAMGSLLSPVLANILMDFLKSIWLHECNINKLKFYLRYVEGILAAFEKVQNSIIYDRKTS